jgi:4-aminobutyrate aminotransferase-like enzyme
VGDLADRLAGIAPEGVDRFLLSTTGSEANEVALRLARFPRRRRVRLRRGWELSEHTASLPAVLQMARGELDLTLAGETVAAREGAWIHIAAGLRHAARAHTEAEWC